MKKYILSSVLFIGTSIQAMDSSESQEQMLIASANKIPKYFSPTDMEQLKNAVRSKEINTITQALQDGFPVNNPLDVENTTLLMLTALENNTDMASFLLTKNANPNKHTRKGWTALMYAARRGHIEMAKLLILYGADENARNSIGQKPYSIALWWNHPELAHELRPRYSSICIEILKKIKVLN